MTIRIGKKRRLRKEAMMKGARKDALLDPKSSATVSWGTIRDALAAQNPDVDRKVLDEAMDSLIKDDRDCSYDLGFSDCLCDAMAVADEVFANPKGADTFKQVLEVALKGRKRKGSVELEERCREMRRKAWNEGAIHGFEKSGEGFNAEYPFMDGKDREFESIVTDDNPYVPRSDDECE